MLHIHFGTGRLGLGLVAPFFKTPESELYLLNRAVSGSNATGSTAVAPERRNALLSDHPSRYYHIGRPGESDAVPEQIAYDAFLAYDEDNIEYQAHAIAKRSAQKRRGIIVSASILKPEHYGPVLRLIDVLGQRRAKGDDVGRIFLVACENTLSAHEVMAHDGLAGPRTPADVTCVRALVDRMCVSLEEDRSGPYPTLRVEAEEYGSLKLELGDETEHLVPLLDGSRITFSRHVDTEKKIKGWLLNGTHWLIALQAFQVSGGDREMNLNEFLNASPENHQMAVSVMKEMRDGVAALLKSDPAYAAFIQSVDPDEYLDQAAASILQRFLANRDPITRILARFHAGSLEAVGAFSKRFADRIEEPIMAYEAERGATPPASAHGVFSLLRLVGSGTYIDGTAG